MAQLRVIKNRMGAVGTIGRITKTMQMIATAKFTSASQRAKSTKPYTERIRELVHEVSASASDYGSPLIHGHSEPKQRELLLVITSDRGMCGAYNGNILKAAIQHIRSCRERGIEVDIEVSGKKAVNFFRFQKIDVLSKHEVGDVPAYEDVEKIASSMIRRYAAGEYDAVHVVYTQFISNARQNALVSQLLPMTPPAEEEDSSSAAGEQSRNVVYDFQPSVDELLDDLLPLMAKTVMFQSFNDAVVSENIMRMIAMKSATENSKEVGRALKQQFNRARQSQITTELTEIISGAAALE
ncbi:MAG: ATP synthase F1 subunit gamma [Phycisphaerales bacterium]|nr:ATP synthase F1 subunit gamma [Phycisphaerales bacterium]